MKPAAVLLIAGHLAASAFLAYCALVSRTHGADTTALLLALVALLQLVSALREVALAEAHDHNDVLVRQLYGYAARARRADQHAAEGGQDLTSACCLTYWETRGAEHDSTSCTREGIDR